MTLVKGCWLVSGGLIVIAVSLLRLARAGSAVPGEVFPRPVSVS